MKLYVNPLILILVAVLALASIVYLGGYNSSTTFELNEVTLDVILERWADALGGAERLASVNSIYTRSQMETSGLVGTLEEWNTSMGQHRQDLNLADVYKTLTVFDGTTENAWILDPNEVVQEIHGIEYEVQLTTSYMLSYSYLVQGRIDGDVEYLGFEENLHVVRATPRGGLPVTFYLDPDTYLPRRSTQPSDSRTLELSYSEWKLFDGLLVATQIDQSLGDPQFDAKITIQEVQINPQIEQTAFERPAEPGPDFSFEDGWRSEGIPIELFNNHIYLETYINGEGPFSFLLDSGAGITVINQSIADSINLDLRGGIEGRGSGEESVQVALASGVDVAVQGVQIFDQTLASIPIDNFAPFEGRHMDGIIGSDFFSRFVVNIDYENLTLNVFDPSEYSYSGAGESFPIIFVENNPMFDAEFEIDNRTYGGKIMIDTGASSSFGISKPFSDANDLLGGGLEVIPVPFAMGVGGESRSLLGRLDAFRIGSFVLPNVIAGFSQAEAGAGANPNRVGVLGGEILRRFNATFIYPQQLLILEPNAHFDEPFDMNMSGLVVRAEGENFNHFVVFRVVEDSPAHLAGIEVGDVINMIDGSSTAPMTLDDIRDLLGSEHGRVLSIELLREDHPIEVELELQRQI